MRIQLKANRTLVNGKETVDAGDERKKLGEAIKAHLKMGE